MDIACYRGMPKVIGEFADDLYANRTILFMPITGISAIAGL